MKCKDCSYLSPRVPLPCFPKFIGYCIKTQNFSLPCFVNDGCPEGTAVRKIKNT